MLRSSRDRAASPLSRNGSHDERAARRIRGERRGADRPLRPRLAAVRTHRRAARARRRLRAGTRGPRDRVRARHGGARLQPLRLRARRHRQILDRRVLPAPLRGDPPGAAGLGLRPQLRGPRPPRRHRAPGGRGPGLRRGDARRRRARERGAAGGVRRRLLHPAALRRAAGAGAAPRLDARGAPATGRPARLRAAAHAGRRRLRADHRRPAGRRRGGRGADARAAGANPGTLARAAGAAGAGVAAGDAGGAAGDAGAPQPARRAGRAFRDRAPLRAAARALERTGRGAALHRGGLRGHAARARPLPRGAVRAAGHAAAAGPAGAGATARGTAAPLPGERLHQQRHGQRRAGDQRAQPQLREPARAHRVRRPVRHGGHRSHDDPPRLARPRERRLPDAAHARPAAGPRGLRGPEARPQLRRADAGVACAGARRRPARRAAPGALADRDEGRDRR